MPERLGQDSSLVDQTMVRARLATPPIIDHSSSMAVVGHSSDRKAGFSGLLVGFSGALPFLWYGNLQKYTHVFILTPKS